MTRVFLVCAIAITFCGLPAPSVAQDGTDLTRVSWCQIDDPATWRINRQVLIDQGIRDLDIIACADRITGPTVPVELTLPMPCGRAMLFRRVDVPVAHALDQILGNFGRSVDIASETPQTVLSNGAWQTAVAGVFTITDDGVNAVSDKLETVDARGYYIAKYELTLPQWMAYDMGLFDLDVAASDSFSAPACSDYNAALAARNLRTIPAVGGLSWYDAIDFSRAYSDWLIRRDAARIAMGQGPDLPWEQGATGYIRLPLESEWEYAARGGASYVTAQERSTRLPLAMDPMTGEIFPGRLEDICAEAPRQADVFLTGVGLKMPNVLGLYDMVCNAEEIVLDLFRPTRPDGRSGQVGGVTTKGGTSYRARDSNTVGWRSETAALFTLSGPGTNATMGTRMAISAPVFVGRRDSGAAYAEGMNNAPFQDQLMSGRAELLSAGVGLPNGESDDLQAQVNQLSRSLSEGELTQAQLEQQADALRVELDRLNVALRDQATEATRLSVRSGIVTGNLIDRVGRNMFAAMNGVAELRATEALDPSQQEALRGLVATIQNNNDRINASFDLYLQVHTELATRDEAFVFQQIREASRGLSGASADVFGDDLARFEQHHREIRLSRGQITEESRQRWLGELDQVRDLRRQRFPDQSR